MQNGFLFSYTAYSFHFHESIHQASYYHHCHVKMRSEHRQQNHMQPASFHRICTAHPVSQTNGTQRNKSQIYMCFKFHHNSSYKLHGKLIWGKMLEWMITGWEKVAYSSFTVDWQLFHHALWSRLSDMSQTICQCLDLSISSIQYIPFAADLLTLNSKAQIFISVLAGYLGFRVQLKKIISKKHIVSSKIKWHG